MTIHHFLYGNNFKGVTMNIRESDIVYENGDNWVYKAKDCYHVMKGGFTHSVGDSAFTLSEDGLSIAKARCDYISRRVARVDGA